MTQLRLLFVLVRPSWLSFFLTLIITSSVIGLSNWAFLAANPWLFDTFYGEHGIITTLEQSPNAVAALRDNIATNPFLYTAGVVILAIVAATVVFVGLRSVERGISAVKAIRRESYEERHEQWQRFLLRLAIAALWIIFLLFSFNFAVPFCILVWRIGVEDASGVSAVTLSLAAGLLLFLTMHVHVIFARLFCLRPRLFGGAAVVESTLITSNHTP